MRPSRVDRALLAALVPLWAVCFALGVRSVLADTATPGVYVAPAESPDAAPVVLGIAPPVRDETALRPGDRLLRIGDTDLAGVGPIELRSIVAYEAAGGRRPEALFERGGTVERTALPIFPFSRAAASQRVGSLVSLATALLLLRAGGSRLARSFGHAFLASAFALNANFLGSPAIVRLSLAVGLPAYALTFPLALRAALRFPREPPRAGPWRRSAPWLLAIHAPLVTTRAVGVPLWGGHVVLMGALAFLVEVAFFASMLAVLTRSYRREDAIGRRQLRWILVTAWWAFAPPIVCLLVSLFEPDLTWLFFASFSTLAFLPVGIVLAIARFNLFDVDRLISATAAWNVLLLLLAVAVLALLPPLAERIADASGLGAGATRVALALALAACLLPAQRRLRPQIERLFFAERYAVDRGVEALLRELSSCAGPQELAQRGGEGVVAIFRPESCVIYARGDADYVPVFASGRALPVGFEADGPLAVALERRREPLVLGEAGRRPDAAPLGPFDRAALESLAAEVVLPVRRGDALRALLCLGPKRSGDVYTPTDVTLLSALAEKVSAELLRFDDARLIQEGREMARSLRRYVPGAIAEQLDRGREPEEGEREVSVLFVDIRGYTAFAEAHPSREVFSSVNRYTEAVSRSVRAHGGAVVEFNGDGMMAVFGAPAPLEAKERCAVEAGLEILAEMERFSRAAQPIEVGVGIASGPAFVGNIRAVDRMIWSAIGTTTNTAARLQQLTRELDASLLVDEATWRALGSLRERFVRHSDVPIRGRRTFQTLYAAASSAPVGRR